MAEWPQQRLLKDYKKGDFSVIAPISGKIDLRGQTAIVTGAARGIGRSVALTLAREGADIIAVDLADTQDTQKAVRDLNRNVLGVTCDVSSKKQVTDMVEQGIKQFDKADILVHSAAITGRQGIMPIEEYDEDEWDRVLDINLKGTFLIVQAVMPHMIAKNYGKIVCVSSLAGKIGGSHSGPPYVASKGGINAFIKWASKAGSASSVYVNGIAPGPVKTAMTEQLNYPDGSMPLQRLGEPEDIAEAALFLASQASNWITGIVLDVNGGRFIG